MNQKLLKLENWWSTYKDYPKLDIKETKFLYQKYCLTNDKQIFEKILNGTMYIIYDQIKNNYYLNFPDFDIVDIIMDSIIIWMDYLKSGKIFKINIFSDYFIRNFHYQLIDTILNTNLQNISTVTLYGIGHRNMANIFFMYIHGLDNNNISLELKNVFDSLNDTAEKIGIDLKLVPYRKVDFIIKPLLYTNLKQRLTPRMATDDKYIEIEEQLYYEYINKIVKKPTKSSQMLLSYYGFYSDEKVTLDKIAKEYNCCKQNVEYKIKRELKNLRKQIK